MTSIKPTIPPEAVLSLLTAFFGDGVGEITPITEGQISRTFSFAADGQGYIIRFADPMVAGFKREHFLFTRLTPQQPRLHEKVAPHLHTGQYEGYEYVVTRRLPGKPLTALNRDEYLQTLPALIETHSFIPQIDVSGTSGYGYVDDNGQGMFPSWREFLMDVREEQDDSLFFGKWHHLFEDTFLDRAQFDAFFAKLLDLMEFCPTERWLVHGDYGFDNVLAQDGQITGVLDWAPRYGDFLADMATLQLWMPDIDYTAMLDRFYREHGLDVPHLAERIKCYMVHTGLDAMRFFAKTNQPHAYEFTCKRLAEI